MPLIARAGAAAVIPTPPTPPPTGLDPTGTWFGLQVVWVGGDGSVWELSSPTSPVWLTPDGTRGLSMPPFDRYTSESPAVAGSRWRGYRAAERPVFWPLYLYGGRPGEAAWRDVDSAFWASLHPAVPGTWSVGQPDGTVRRLTCRYSDDGEQAYGLDPFVSGWAAYGVSLVAEDPFWRGETITRTFDTAAPANFYGGGAGTLGPPFVISSNTSTASAAIDNPGDEPAWPVWTGYGPFSSLTVGVGTRLVSLPLALASGKSITIDTRPDRLSAVDSDGVDRVPDLGVVRFAPVPSGSSVPVSISVPGSSSDTRVAVSIDPPYHRAW